MRHAITLLLLLALTSCASVEARGLSLDPRWIDGPIYLGKVSHVSANGDFIEVEMLLKRRPLDELRELVVYRDELRLQTLLGPAMVVEVTKALFVEAKMLPRTGAVKVGDFAVWPPPR